MATSIINKIADELAELEQQLHKFKSSVEYINKAKESLTTAINAVAEAENYHLQKLDKIEKVYDSHNKIVEDVKQLSEKINTVDFPKRLTSIDKGLSEVISGIDKSTKTTLDELKKAAEAITKANFDGRFNNLNTIINDTATKTQAATTLFKTQNDIQGRDIKESFRAGRQHNEQLFQDQRKFIESLQLQIKFERLEKSILSEIQSVQSKIDGIDRNIEQWFKHLDEQQKDAFGNASKIQEKEFADVKLSIEKNAKKQQLLGYISWGLIPILIAISLVIMRKAFHL
jgi:hypothetical protein